MPPEFIGLKALDQLNEAEWNALNKNYIKMKYDLKVVGEYVSVSNVNMLIEMCQAVAKRVGMGEDKLKNAFSMILEDLNVVEAKLGIKLGPMGMAQRKHENFTNNFLLSYLQKQDIEAKTALTESAKLRKCLG